MRKLVMATKGFKIKNLIDTKGDLFKNRQTQSDNDKTLKFNIK